MERHAYFCSAGLWPPDAPVVIVGCGGLGRELLGICYELGVERRVLGFVDVDRRLHGRELDQKAVLGDDDWLLTSKPKPHFLLGVGDNGLRRQIALRLEKGGLEPATLVSPQAVVSRYARIAQGSVVCPGSIISTNVAVGPHCVVNPACTLGHDARLGSYVHLAPGVRVSGWVTLGEGAFIGTGAAINARLSVGEWATVGSMAAVTKSVASNATVAGVPARVIDERAAGWHL